jgi:hypothetical protein
MKQPFSPTDERNEEPLSGVARGIPNAFTKLHKPSEAAILFLLRRRLRLLRARLRDVRACV